MQLILPPLLCPICCIKHLAHVITNNPAVPEAAQQCHDHIWPWFSVTDSFILYEKN